MEQHAYDAPTVLVVDDNPDLVDVLTFFLSQQGMVAFAAYSGWECVKKVRQLPIDVVLLDVEMSGLNGLETCVLLREQLPLCFIPIILMADKDDLQTRLAGVNLGVSEFLLKPMKGRDLLTRIETQVETLRKVQSLERALRHMEGNVVQRAVDVIKEGAVSH